MSTIGITKKLDSETLVLPELRPFIGKTVEIQVSAEPSTELDDLIDWEYLAELEAEEADDPTPLPTLEEVRAILSKIPGNWSAEIIADREDRV